MPELNLEVLFESWLVLNESYPPFKKHDKIKIAIMAEEPLITPMNKKQLFLNRTNTATYEFSGKSIKYGVF